MINQLKNNNKRETSDLDDGLFLPDFCNVRTIFVVIFSGELLAILLTLAGNTRLSDSLGYLGLSSFFILWIGLSSCAILCWTRSILSCLTQTQAGIVTFCLILLLTVICSLISLQLLQQHVEHPLFNMNEQSFIVSNLLISGMTSALLLRYFYIQYHWKQKVRSEAEAKVQALQSRIRPHFLFNSMNIIASLTRSNPPLAEQAVEDLSDLFRASLAGNQDHNRWEEELHLSQQYLHIEQLRLDDRLSIDWQIDSLPKDAILPPLTLQPILENTIYHGIEPLPAGGTVLIRGNRAGSQLSILIENPITKSNAAAKKGHQIAQKNVSERLNLFFEGRGSLKAKETKNHYSVTLTFPYITHT